MNFKEIFNNKNKNLRFLTILILAVIFLFYESTESKLIDRLGNNNELIQKFDDFKLGGYENDISLSYEKMENKNLFSIIFILETYF